MRRARRVRRLLSWPWWLLASFLFGHLAFATGLEPLRFQLTTRRDGLGSPSVLSIAQDRSGHVWLGTSNGLKRYDGQRFVSFLARPEDPRALDSDLVYHLLADAHQALWIGTAEGLNRLDLRTDTISRVPGPARVAGPLGLVRGLAPAGNDALWVLFRGGLYRLALATQALAPVDMEETRWLPTAPAGTMPPAPSMVSDGAGGVWVGLGTVVVHVLPDGSRGAVLDTASDLPGPGDPGRVRRAVYSLALDASQRLWVGTQRGVQVWQVSGGAPVRTSLGERVQVADGLIPVLFTDRSGDVWIAVRFVGMYRWRHAEEMLERVQFSALEKDAGGADGDTAACFFQDADDVLWVGTWGNGVGRTDLSVVGPTRYVHSPHDASSLADHRIISAIVMAGDHQAWVGTFGGGLNLLDLRDGRAVHYPSTLFGGGHIKTLVKTREGGLWVGTEDFGPGTQGLYFFDPRTGRATAHDWPDRGGSRTVHALALDGHGNLWVGSSWGVRRLGPSGRWLPFDEGGEPPSQLSGLDGVRVRAILPMADGKVWVASLSGIYLWDPVARNFQRPIQPSPGVAAPQALTVMAMRRDDAGRVWVGASQGLFQLKATGTGWMLEPWNSFPGGLVLENIESMQDSRDGMLWVFGDQGAVRIDPLQRQAARFPSLTEAGTDFYFDSAARTPDGRILVGTRGLISFPPERVRENDRAPRVTLSDLLLFNRSVPASGRDVATLRDLGVDGLVRDAGRIVLSYRQNMVGFELAALHFSDPRQNRFAWKLDGFDTQWIYARPEVSTATYTNLDPGHYVFRFKAAGTSGVWTPSPRAIDVVVLPPFWQTWWWYAGLAAVLALVVFGAFQWRVRRLHQARAALEQQVKERTQEVVEQTARATREKAESDAQREAAEKARRTIGDLSDMGREIMASLDTDAVIRKAAECIASLMTVRRIRLTRIDTATRQLEATLLWQSGRLKTLSQARAGRVLPDDPSLLTSRCLAEPHGLLVLREPGQPPLSIDSPGWAHAAVLVPLTAKGLGLGVVAVYSETPGAYGTVHLNMLRTLASYAAAALSNAEAYRRLQQTQARLVEQEKLAALGALVAGVAHELNTPLGNSLLLANTLMAQMDEFVKHAAQGLLKRSDLTRYSQRVHESTRLLLSSLGSASTLVRSFKQVSTDQTADLRRPVDLRLLCEGIAATLANQLRPSHHELAIDVPEGITLDTYPGSLGQVLTNLITNALVHGFADRHHGRMQIKGDALRTGWVRLLFSDDGAGIARAHLSKVFEPFFTTRMGQGGSGLGLHISYNIVTALLGGSISVTSRLGEGTLFTLELPVTAPLRPGDAT